MIYIGLATGGRDASSSILSSEVRKLMNEINPVTNANPPSEGIVLNMDFCISGNVYKIDFSEIRVFRYSKMKRRIVIQIPINSIPNTIEESRECIACSIVDSMKLAQKHLERKGVVYRYEEAKEYFEKCTGLKLSV